MQKLNLNPWQVRQTSAEIDLGKIKKNFLTLKKWMPRIGLTAVIKSDAYGHGALPVAQALNSLPVVDRPHAFAVANVEEGIELRRAGILGRIYILSGIQFFNEEMLHYLESCDLIPVISSFEVLQQLGRVLKKKESTLLVHLKFNAGMNRLGIDPEDVVRTLKLLKNNPRILLEGIMSHFAAAENPLFAHTKSQVNYFSQLKQRFIKDGFSLKYVHMENSAGYQHRLFPEGNMARIGLHLYGLGNPRLSAALQWRAQVYQVREVLKDSYVGYGPRYRAKKRIKIAVLGVGYADGFKRAFSNQADVLIGGVRCPVVGTVSMDLTAVDISRAPIGKHISHAVLIGADGKDKITAEELAKISDTIPYEIVTGISQRVPRTYIND